MIKKDEIFEKFYIRFIFIIISLKYIDVVKITNLTRLLTIRLRYRLIRYAYKSFRELIKFLRKLNINLRLIDNTITSARKKNNNIIKNINKFFKDN